MNLVTANSENNHDISSTEQLPSSSLYIWTLGYVLIYIISHIELLLNHARFRTMFRVVATNVAS
jgi:hypothetical protein